MSSPLKDPQKSPAKEAAGHASSVTSGVLNIKDCVTQPQFLAKTVRMERALQQSLTGPATFTQGGVTGVVKSGEVSNKCVQLVLDTAKGEKTVSALTSKAAVLGKVTGVAGGILGVGSSLWDLNGCLNDVFEGHKMAKEFKTMVERLRSLVRGYTEEQDSEPKKLLLQELQQLKEEAEAVKAEIDLHHSATEGSRAIGNVVGLGASGCIIAAPFTLGAAGIVAVALSMVSGAASAGVTVGKSWQGYVYRQQLAKLHDRSTAARIQYHKASPSHPLLAKPGKFTFIGPFHIQWYMSVTFTTYDGHTIGPRFSCDTDFWESWYGGTIYVDPGAINVSVRFSARGGGNCHQVDRSNKSLPWIRDSEGNRILETFRFERGDGLECHFELAGHLSRPYVKSVCIHPPHHPRSRL